MKGRLARLIKKSVQFTNLDGELPLKRAPMTKEEEIAREIRREALKAQLIQLMLQKKAQA